MKGWRAWGLSEDKHGPVLCPPEFCVQGVTFPERESWARCLESDHTPPKRKCLCGLYSAESLDAARTWLPFGTIAVAGKVELLGRVVQGSNHDLNRTLTAFMPLIGTATGRHVSAEYRSAGVRLVGKQGVHPDHADSVAALASRYGVPFYVDEEIAESVDIADEIISMGRQMQTAYASAGSTGKAAGLVLVSRERTHVVLQKRSAYVDHAGTWAFVGGSVKSGVRQGGRAP